MQPRFTGARKSAGRRYSCDRNGPCQTPMRYCYISMTANVNPNRLLLVGHFEFDFFLQGPRGPGFMKPSNTLAVTALAASAAVKKSHKAGRKRLLGSILQDC